MMELPYAEDIGHYWQTSQSSPDMWMDRAKKLIEGLDGTILAEGFGSVESHAAYMIAFKVEEDNFKVVWPVLPSRTGKALAAKRQAATLLYHDIKAKAMTASVLGTRVAFFSYMMLRMAGAQVNWLNLNYQKFSHYNYHQEKEDNTYYTQEAKRWIKLKLSSMLSRPQKGERSLR